jgi:hypothetical protein
MASQNVIEVELLRVPGCPNAEVARRLLHASINELGVDARVVERVGAYASPTLLVEGSEVMGRPTSGPAGCRLDLPTHDRVVAALRAAAASTKLREVSDMCGPEEMSRNVRRHS